MKVKKILHIVATNKLSGAEKVVSDICTNLDNNYTPIVICAGDPLRKYYEEKGIKVYCADISGLKLSEIKKIRKVVEFENIDIIHGHDVKASIGGYLAGRSRGIPVVSHMHTPYEWMKGRSPLKYIDRFFRKKYALSIACSKEVKSYYIAHNNSVDAEKVIYMDNSFNFNEFNKYKIADKDEFKSKLNIKDSIYVFGFLGRLLEIKGADLMIEAFNEIKNKAADSVLLIVGDGEEREHLENLVKQFNIEDRVIFAGYQKNVYDYMNVFDCFILPSVREGLPMAVLEAMAMKKPVISTPVSGLKNLITQEYNGLILDERTKKKLADAMLRMYSDKDMADKIAENAYSYILDKYNINKYMQQLQEIYNKI